MRRRGVHCMQVQQAMLDMLLEIPKDNARTARRSVSLTTKEANKQTLGQELSELLNASCAWEFDCWKLTQPSRGTPLSTLGYWAIYRLGLIGSLGLDDDKLMHFLCSIEQISPAHPFHNPVKVVSNVQAMFTLLSLGENDNVSEDPLVCLACMLAAIIHHLGHVGFSNDHLIAIQHPLAIMHSE